MNGKVIAVSQTKNREYEELNGRCPNCGAKLPEAKGNVIQCEYCDSRFVEVGKQDALKDNYINMMEAYYETLAELESKEEHKICRVGRLEESRMEYINQLKATAKQYREYADNETGDYVIEVKT